ncbi:hypothetical protein BDR07DRAFT_1383166 [Suillus spraguei]|nr:hypothetical protein BDR07DRAFT_1383166 [Suillus spraguei]
MSRRWLPLGTIHMGTTPVMSICLYRQLQYVTAPMGSIGDHACAEYLCGKKASFVDIASSEGLPVGRAPIVTACCDYMLQTWLPLGTTPTLATGTNPNGSRVVMQIITTGVVLDKKRVPFGAACVRTRIEDRTCAPIRDRACAPIGDCTCDECLPVQTAPLGTMAVHETQLPLGTAPVASLCLLPLGTVAACPVERAPIADTPVVIICLLLRGLP